MKSNLFTTVSPAGPETSFRLYLQAELARRCTGNPQYSLRAFAKFLTIDHATLSQLLRGKRALTSRTISRLGAKLGLDREKLDHYCAAAGVGDNSLAPQKYLREMEQRAQDTAAAITEWQHYAILELTRLPAFRPDTRWIARVLGLSPDEVNIAASRLARLGLLKMVSRSRWIDCSGDTTVTRAAFAQASIDRLADSARARKGDTPDHSAGGFRIHGTTTLALSQAKLRLLHDRIARFQRELGSLVDEAGSLDDVFQLEIRLFPVTNLGQPTECTHGKSSDAVAADCKGS